MAATNEIFYLSASDIMFANAHRDWPKGGGWYVNRYPTFLGPFEHEETAILAAEDDFDHEEHEALLRDCCQDDGMAGLSYVDDEDDAP